jgi:diketogulonate reductase-like aldo/keto reductase
MFSSNLGVDTLRDTEIPLKDGSGSIPALGFGTLIADPVATRQAVQAALEVGFRQFDCSERYRNEAVVGEAFHEAFAQHVVRREDIFVATKLWNNHHRPEYVRPAFEASLARLGLDYVDLYLVHTPFAFKPGEEQDPRDAGGKVIYDDGVTLADTWMAMEDLVKDGRCKSIGVSDISVEQVAEISAGARIAPTVVHVEAHPYLPQWELLRFCKDRGIVLQAFAALGHGMEPRLLDDPVITAVAQRVHKTPAQVLLAWGLQRGTALLTTSTTPSRIRENFDVSTLPDDAIQEINAIKKTYRYNAVTQTGIPSFIPRTKP